MTEKDLDIAIEKCERIMEMDTRTMQNPVSENGWIFEKVYELLQYLRQLQFATDTNVATTDTISRQAAIEAFAPYAEYESNRTNAEWVRRINMVLSALPPTQPEIIRCKDCRYNNDCEIQYSAQSGDEFFCGCAEGKDNG